MVLTRLEKATFVVLGVMLLLGSVLVFFEIQASRTRNGLVLQQIRKIQALTPKVPLKKDYVIAGEEDDQAGKLNVNKATVAQLQALPKVGKTTAERIVAFCKERGGIKNLNELREIKGMSRKKLKALSRFLTAKGGTTTLKGAGPTPKNRLNLNFATVEQFQALPGLGRKMAQEIIDFRNRNGRFFSLEDLQEIPGLADAKIRKFLPLVSVR